MRLGFSSLRLLSALILAIVASFGVISAQVSTSRGTMGLVEGRRHMVAFPQVWASTSELPVQPNPMLLFISSKVKTTVRIETPAGINDASRLSRTLTLQPNVVLKFPVPIGYMNGPDAQTRKGYGISVIGEAPISVSTFQAWQGNGELARHLPVEAWGKNYYSMNFYQDRYNTDKYRPSQILLIAEKDNTIVTFTPTVDTEAGSDAPSVRKGTPGTVSLNKGETFLIKNVINSVVGNKEFSTDLSGTSIKSNKPIGVVSGHTKVAIMRFPDFLPPGGATEAHFVRNNVHDAMLPLEMGGTQFITVPVMYTAKRLRGQASAELGLDDDRGDVIRVVALEDNTTVKVRNQSTGAFLNVAKLAKRGDSYRETSLEKATFWETDKPVLMGQYGKSWAKIIPPGGGGKEADATQGHPTVESGMPMLQYVPSVDRWVNYATFYSPEGMDNFFNITFRTADFGKIRFDGKTLPSVFGGAIRELPGTEFSTVSAPVAIGDHWVESVDENVKWAGWTYGSLDGMEMGRAYGTPVAVDLAIQCPDSLDVKEVLVCGDVDANAKILPENTTCGSVFSIYAESLDNYELKVDETFNSGDKKAHFTLTVTDKRKDASATVLVVSRSGKFVRKTYTYLADKISFTPESVNFGVAALRTPVTREVTVTNETDRPVTIKKIKVKNFPGIFVPTPAGAFTLPPRDSKTITVTAIITAVTPVVDTLIAELECFDQNLSELKIRGEEPQIFVSDVPWGKIPASDPGRFKEVIISNPSGAELIVFDYNREMMPDAAVLPNTPGQTERHFFEPMRLDDETKPLHTAMPLKIAPGGTYKFKVKYSPLGVSATPHREDVPFYSNAQNGPDSIAVLTGEGTNATVSLELPSFDVRVLDGVAKAAGSVYVLDATFTSVGSKAVTFTEAPVPMGADAKYFRFGENDFGGFPVQVMNGDKKHIKVYFTPDPALLGAGEEPRSLERNFILKTEMKTDDVDPKTNAPVIATDEKTSSAWQPQVIGEDHDFGIFSLTDAPVVYNIPVSNDHWKGLQTNAGNTKGTHDVAIYDIVIVGANAGKFEILEKPTPGNPWIIKPTDAPIMLPVRFSPAVAGAGEYTIAGSNATTIRFITEPAGVGNRDIVRGPITPGAADYTPEYNLQAIVVGGDFAVTNAHDEVYVHHEKVLTVNVTHKSNVEAHFRIDEPVPTDGRASARFEILTPANRQLDIPAGGVGQITVRFIPDAVTSIRNGQGLDAFTGGKLEKAAQQNLVYNAEQFSATIAVTDLANETSVQTSTVTGDGLYLETTNFIRDDYEVDVKQTVNVGIELAPAPESLNSADVRELRYRVFYDGTLLRPDMSKVIFKNNQAEGWQMPAARVSDDNTYVEFDIVDMDNSHGQLSNSNVRPVVEIPFFAYLGRGTQSNMTSDMGLYTYWVDHNGDKNDLRYVYFNDIPGKVKVNLNCAATKRLVTVSAQGFGVEPVAPNPVVNGAVINYSVGLDGNTRIVLLNSMGQEVLDIVNEYQQRGTYAMSVDFSQLPAGVYYYQVVSGPYTSEMLPLNIVR